MDALLRRWGTEIDDHAHDEDTNTSLTSAPPLCPYPIYGDLLHTAVTERPDLRKTIFASMLPTNPNSTSSPAHPSLSMSKSEPLFTKQQRPQTATGWARTPLQPSSVRGASGGGGRPLSSSTRAASSTGGRWGLAGGGLPASASSSRRPLARSSSSLGSTMPAGTGRPMTATSSRVFNNKATTTTISPSDVNDPKAKLYASLKKFVDTTTTSTAVTSSTTLEASTLISIATHQPQDGGGAAALSSASSVQNPRRRPSSTSGRINTAPPLFTPTHLASKHSCFDFPIHRAHETNWGSACVAWEKWLEQHEAGNFEEQQREEREEAALQVKLEQQRKDRISRLHVEIDEWVKEEKEVLLAATAAAADEVITTATKPPTPPPPGIALRSGGGGGCSDSEEDAAAPQTRPHTPVRSSCNDHQQDATYDEAVDPNSVTTTTRTPSFSAVTPASFTTLDTATRSDLKFYVPTVTAACRTITSGACGGDNGTISPPIAASSTDGAIACFDQASQRFQQGDPMGALHLLQSLLPSAAVTSRCCTGAGYVTPPPPPSSSVPPSPSDTVPPPHPQSITTTSTINENIGSNTSSNHGKSKEPSRPGTGSGAYHRRRLSDTIRGAVTSGRPSSSSGGGGGLLSSSSGRRTTTPPPPSHPLGQKPTPPNTTNGHTKSTIQLQPFTSDYYSALLLQQNPPSSSTSSSSKNNINHHTNNNIVFLGVPNSLLTNIALCHYTTKDFQGALRVVAPMLAMGTDPTSITPLGLVIALRSSLLLVDIRSSKIALSKLMRYKSSFLTTGGGGSGGGLGVCNGDDVLRGYSLCIDHLERYRDCTNRSQHADALAHITAACSASFHHVAFEAMRLDTMCYARPAAEVHDDLLQLLEAYPSEQSLWALKAHLIFLFSTSPTTAGGSSSISSSLCAWNALRGAQQAALRALSTSKAECPRAASYLRMLRTVSQRIQTAEDFASQKKWRDAFVEYAQVVSGNCMRVSKDDEESIGQNNTYTTTTLFGQLSSSHVTYSGRGCDVETLALLAGGIAASAPFTSCPELTSTELQNIVQQSIFILTTVKIEMLHCQLKAGMMEGVIEACSLLLNPKPQRRTTTTPSPSSPPPPPPPISPTTATISTSILKSFRAQAYVQIGKYKEGYADAKEVYAAAPSPESKEFIDYIESYLYPDRPPQPKQGEGGKKRASNNNKNNDSGRRRTTTTTTDNAALYRVLGLSFDATTTDIAKAYKVAALRWHPDKWASGTDEEKEVAEDNFKKANNAYSTLTESESK